VSATFVTPGRVVTGRGSLETVGAEAARLGKRALLVTGRQFARRTGLTDRVLGLLQRAGVPASVYDDVPPEPTLAQADEARRLALREHCDLLVGLGGGSAVDVGKVAAGLVHESAPLREFFDGREIAAPGIPFIAIPTTAGTGAEATPNGVLTDPERLIKRSIRAPSLMPAVAIVDPDTTMEAGLVLTAQAGMDALTQAVEAHISRHSYSLTQALSRQAVVLLARALVRLADDLDDPDAREDAALGSLMAGMALANARLGVVHGLAHPLGARYGISHGRVCGILLPHAIRFNAEAAEEDLADLSDAVGQPLADFAEATLVNFGMPLTLRELHVPREDVRSIVVETLNAGSTQANPRDVTEEDLTALLEAVI
jgi:alcohol dehydrogenase class IV